MNAAGSGLPSLVPDARLFCSATSLAGRCAITPSRPSTVRRRRVRSIVSASMIGPSMFARTMARVWRSIQTVRITRRGSPTAVFAKGSSTPTPKMAAGRSPNPCRSGAGTAIPPFVIAAQGAVWLAWKEFDGEESTVNVMRSEDGGRNWSAPKPIAHTADASDHPQLVSNGHSVFLSWMTRADGYQFVSLENAP